MFIPFLTPHKPASERRKRSLERRRGGGGKGSGSSGGSSGGTNKGGSVGGSSSSGGRSSSVSTPNLAGSTGGRSTTTAYGAGGGSPITIPAGQAFAGRSAGSGTRTQVFGSNVYGSGYPGLATQRGVTGLGFPFFFWPVVWGGAGLGGAAYLHRSDEYGNPDNSTRPGGPMAQAAFQSNTTGTIYRLVSDNTTVASLITSINDNCTSFDLGNTVSAPAPYTGANSDPQPEQAVQYYRASSVSLTLDGYNNTAALSNDTTAAATPLPSGIDTVLLGCLNDTIGAAVPLVDGAGALGVPSIGALALLWMTLAAFQRL